MRNGVRKLMIGALAAASLAVADGAAAQSRSRMQVIDGGHRISVETNGQVRFTDDDRGVAHVAPGASVVIEESRPGRPDRRVVYRNRGGAIERRFYRDDRPATPSADDEAWIAGMIERAVRESGMNAEERAGRIYRRGGVDAVLREIERIGSDGTRRRYYTALMRHPLSPAETARVLRDAGRRIASDGEKQGVLATLLDRGRASDEEMVAMLEAAQHIASDGDKSRLLVRTAGRDALDDPRVRAAFFRTAATIASDGDKSRVLIAALGSGEVRRESTVDALRTARTIASDGDKSRVLTAVPPRFLRDRSVRAAYESAMQSIASDGDRSRVALFLARSLP